MKEIGKYNLFKGISTVLTTGVPIFTASLFSDFFVSSNSASVSAVGVIAILLAILFMKDKIAENFKLPSPFIVATVLFVIILFLESILLPMKWICLSVMIVCGIDELTFKRIYKRIELLMPERAKAYKNFGFYICKTETIMGVKNEQD